MRKLLFLLVPFFLTSCISIQSRNQVDTSGTIQYNSVVDMSGMIAAMSSLTGASTPPDEQKNLCKDFDTKEATLTGFYRNMSCESLGDYRARILSELPVANNPGIFVGSGVIVFNPFWTKVLEQGTATSGDNMMNSDIDMGITIENTFHFPYPVVYRDGGKLLDTDSVLLNMVDKKILAKRDLFIIARVDGKKPTAREIARYKRLLRVQIISAKKSGKYDDFEEVLGL